MAQKVLYLDTETTGLDPVVHDVIQIAGAIEIDGEPVDEFCLFAQPMNWENISQEALDLRGLNVDDLKAYPTAGQAYRELVRIWSKHINKYDRADKFAVAGQNVRFALDFMASFFRKQGDKYFGSWISWQPIDLMYLASILRYSGKLPVENLKLGTVAQALGIEFQAHDALEDIRTTRTVLRELIGRHIH